MLENPGGPDPGHHPPRWEPAYAAALARIGLNLVVTPRMEEECAPFS
jgi:hypothetical protein